MKKIISIMATALLILCLTSSISADPPNAYEGRYFTVHKLGQVSRPAGNTVVLTGDWSNLTGKTYLRIELMQTRGGKTVTGFWWVWGYQGDEFWEMKIQKFNGEFKPGPAVIKILSCTTRDLYEEAHMIDVILTGKPIK